MRKLYIIWGMLFVLHSIFAEEICNLSLPLINGMSRADLFYLSPTGKEQAVLVLCPGYNGNGKFLLLNQEWRSFAQKNNLGVVGLAFMSPGKDPKSENFYYYADKGSGKLLVDGLKKIYGRDMPIFLYGFSGGAHFVSRFVEWQPKIVMAWCAYSAAWWDKPKPNQTAPPGIVACGKDDSRQQASLNYFWDGRELGRAWLWIEIDGIGHAQSSLLESFIRDYFETILEHSGSAKTKEGAWVNIYEHNLISAEYAARYPCATAWLPQQNLYKKWLLLTKGQGKTK